MTTPGDMMFELTGKHNSISAKQTLRQQILNTIPEHCKCIRQMIDHNFNKECQANLRVLVDFEDVIVLMKETISSVVGVRGIFVRDSSLYDGKSFVNFGKSFEFPRWYRWLVNISADGGYHLVLEDDVDYRKLDILRFHCPTFFPLEIADPGNV